MMIEHVRRLHGRWQMVDEKIFMKERSFFNININIVEGVQGILDAYYNSIQVSKR